MIGTTLVVSGTYEQASLTYLNSFQNVADILVSLDVSV